MRTIEIEVKVVDNDSSGRAVTEPSFIPSPKSKFTF